VDLHAEFKGVVPEIAARAHLSLIQPLMDKLIDQTGLKMNELSAIAATSGPGLIGGVIVGMTYAKALAQALNIPYLAINHLEGHLLTPRMTDGIGFPYLTCLISGGHSQFLWVTGIGEYRVLGTTIDDAVGEAFDKTAKLLGLGYPGGPALERLAGQSDIAQDPFDLPRPLLNDPDSGANLSLSGLKTAVRRIIDRRIKRGAMNDSIKADLARAFHFAIGDILVDRTRQAVTMVETASLAGRPLALVGGVAANQYLRKRMSKIANELDMKLITAPMEYCTDNAAMIAWAGYERYRSGGSDDLSFAPRPRWPLDELHSHFAGSDL
jgi:N6-L-threonylcarbamoyladenine synthase